MLVGPIEPTRFFSSDGKVRLRGRWTAKQAELLRGSRFHIVNKLRGAKLLGYSSEHFFSSAHVIYPLLRPAMEELFEKFKPAFLANAAYRFRNRKQFWPVSAHDHQRSPQTWCTTPDRPGVSVGVWRRSPRDPSEDRSKSD